jgi:hypothetical protein
VEQSGVWLENCFRAAEKRPREEGIRRERSWKKVRVLNAVCAVSVAAVCVCVYYCVCVLEIRRAWRRAEAARALLPRGQNCEFPNAKPEMAAAVPTKH